MLAAAALRELDRMAESDAEDGLWLRANVELVVVETADDPMAPLLSPPTFRG